MSKKKTVELKAWKTRRWLNNDESGGTAFISADVEEVAANYKHAYASGTISIADCSRIVNLEFYSDDDDDPGSIANAMQKLDTIVFTISEFRGRLREALEAVKRSAKNAEQIAESKKAEKK